MVVRLELLLLRLAPLLRLAAHAGVNAVSRAHPAVQDASSCVKPSCTAEERLFDQLCTEFGVYSQVKLTTPRGSERGLYCKKAIAAGEPLLAVPWQMCLVVDPSAADVELQSPWHAPLEPSCESRLAAELLDALHAPCAAEEEQQRTDGRRMFWRQWATLLPPAATLTHPIALPAQLLAELQHSELAAAGLSQAPRYSLHFRMMRSACERCASDCHPACQAARADALLKDSPLPANEGHTDPSGERRWAMAMCSSRPFRMAAAAKLGAFVPFIDMANHAAEPNCEVQGRAESGGEGYSAVGLVATRDLAEGEEALISCEPCRWNGLWEQHALCLHLLSHTWQGQRPAYFKITNTRNVALAIDFDGVTNAMSFSKFGFIVHSNRHDRLEFPPSLDRLSADALRHTVRSCKDEWPGGARLEAALLSLPLSREPSNGPAHEVDAATELLRWMRQHALSEFRTSIESDEAALKIWEEDMATGSGDSRLGAVLNYRLERKRLWMLTERIVEAHRILHEKAIP